MPKVSIIIPAYNVEKYLTEAVNSAVNQTLKDIEILIVDDASTDDTFKIAEKFAEEDKRIHIIKNENNMGILASRYRGLQRAESDFIMFLDADDRLVLNACEVLSNTMDKYSFDLIQFNTTIENEGSNLDEGELTELKKYLKIPQGPFSQKIGGMLEYAINDKISFNVWNKIYRKDILIKALNQYNCERIQMSEDFLLTIMVLTSVARFGTTSQVLYVYRLGSGMSTVRKIREESVNDYALISKVDSLLKKWIPNTEIDESLKKNTLDFTEKKLHNNILYVYTERIPDGLRKKFINAVSEYWNYQDFVKAYSDYVQKQNIPNEKAAEMLKNSLPYYDSNQHKVIGMFYNRMYNGGIERVISLLVPIMIHAGYKVIVITEEGSTVADYKLPEGVRHIKLSSSGVYSSLRVEEWQNIINKYNIDTVVYHAWVGRKIVLDSMAIKSMGIQLILHVHGSFQYVFRMPFNFKENYFKQDRIYMLFDKVVVLSEVDKAWAEAIGLNAFTVMNPLTFDKNNVRTSDLSSLNVIWVGRLSLEKQYYDAFQIAKQVHNKIPNFRLRVVGRTERNEDFQKITEYLFKNDMAEYVLLEGEQSNVEKYYSESAVFLMTSEFEGFPMVFQEAKVFGLPIVSYELPNLTMQRQQKNGVIVVPQRDIESAANAIIELLENEELRIEEGKLSRNSVDRLYEKDLGEIWKNIIETPIELDKIRVPAYLDSPINTAIRIALENTAIGFENAMKFKNGRSAAQYLQDVIALQMRINDDNETDERIEAYKMEISCLRRNAEEDRSRLNTVYDSKTYRLGKAILSPLRFFKKVFNRG